MRFSSKHRPWLTMVAAPSIWSSFVMSVVITMLMSGCRTSRSVSLVAFSPIKAPPARVGEILVMINGGPVTNRGKHWFPENTTLAMLLDWAGLDSVALPRNVYIVDPKGHAVRHRVLGRPRKELEQIKVNHGTRIVVPWDRCFGLESSPYKVPPFDPLQPLSGLRDSSVCHPA